MGSDYGALAVWGAFMGLFFILVAVMYILFAYGLYTMANRRNIENAWLAWIPIGQFYTMGEVIGPLKIGDFHVDKPGLYLLLGMAGCMVLAQIPNVGIIFSLAMTILTIGALYYLFSGYTTENTPLLYTILSFVTLGFLAAVFIFIIRENDYQGHDDTLTI